MSADWSEMYRLEGRELIQDTHEPSRTWLDTYIHPDDRHDAVAMAPLFRPDVILLDIGMPDVNGYEVARQLRSLPGLQGVTLVALTGRGQPEDKRRAAEAGFDQHLTKPVDPSVVSMLIRDERAVAS